MKKLSIKLSLALFMGLFLFSACSKDGETGPAGATGPQGPTGATGATGTAGPAGAAGTANVIYSAWLDVAYKPDTIMQGTVILDTIGYYGSIAATKLDNTILNSGEVKVYLNLGTPTTPDIFPLPYFDVYSGISVSPDYSLQSINLYSNINAGTITVSGVKRQQYRYILIPGGTAARSAIDWKNYSEVKAYLGLKD